MSVSSVELLSASGSSAVVNPNSTPIPSILASERSCHSANRRRALVGNRCGGGPPTTLHSSPKYSVRQRNSSSTTGKKPISQNSSLHFLATATHAPESTEMVGSVVPQLSHRSQPHGPRRSPSPGSTTWRGLEDEAASSIPPCNFEDELRSTTRSIESSRSHQFAVAHASTQQQLHRRSLTSTFLSERHGSILPSAEDVDEESPRDGSVATAHHPPVLVVATGRQPHPRSPTAPNSLATRSYLRIASRRPSRYQNGVAPHRRSITTATETHRMPRAVINLSLNEALLRRRVSSIDHPTGPGAGSTNRDPRDTTSSGGDRCHSRNHSSTSRDPLSDLLTLPVYDDESRLQLPILTHRPIARRRPSGSFPGGVSPNTRARATAFASSENGTACLPLDWMTLRGSLRALPTTHTTYLSTSPANVNLGVTSVPTCPAGITTASLGHHSHANNTHSVRAADDKLPLCSRPGTTSWEVPTMPLVSVPRRPHLLHFKSLLREDEQQMSKPRPVNPGRQGGSHVMSWLPQPHHQHPSFSCGASAKGRQPLLVSFASASSAINNTELLCDSLVSPVVEEEGTIAQRYGVIPLNAMLGLDDSPTAAAAERVVQQHLSPIGGVHTASPVRMFTHSTLTHDGVGKTTNSGDVPVLPSTKQRMSLNLSSSHSVLSILTSPMPPHQPSNERVAAVESPTSDDGPGLLASPRCHCPSALSWWSPPQSVWPPGTQTTCPWAPLTLAAPTLGTPPATLCDQQRRFFRFNSGTNLPVTPLRSRHHSRAKMATRLVHAETCATEGVGGTLNHQRRSPSTQARTAGVHAPPVAQPQSILRRSVLLPSVQLSHEVLGKAGDNDIPACAHITSCAKPCGSVTLHPNGRQTDGHHTGGSPRPSLLQSSSSVRRATSPERNYSTDASEANHPCSLHFLLPTVDADGGEGFVVHQPSSSILCRRTLTTAAHGGVPIAPNSFSLASHSKISDAGKTAEADLSVGDRVCSASASPSTVTDGGDARSHGRNRQQLPAARENNRPSHYHSSMWNNGTHSMPPAFSEACIGEYVSSVFSVASDSGGGDAMVRSGDSTTSAES